MQNQDIIKIPTSEEIKDTYTKVFRMQATGADGQTVRVSVPREIVRREAKRHRLSIKQFLEHFCIEWRYNSFPGFYGIFVNKDGKNA